MGKLCMIMQHTNLCTPCIAFMLVSHTCIFTINHAEQGREEPPEPAPVEGVNCEQDQGKTRCIPLQSLSFIFGTLIIILFDCALSLQDFCGTVAALGFFLPGYPCLPCYNSYSSLAMTRRSCRVR
jgi:hypothetical protein